MNLRVAGLSALLFVSGALGLIYEVCWSRELALRVGLGERGAALTLAAFFLGMTAGYALAARLTQVVSAWRGYALCELAIAGWAVCLPALAASLPGAGGFGFWLLLLPPCVAMGASLPFALEALARAQGNVSLAYAAQLAGATLGALLATFWWIELLGVWRSTYSAAALSAGCGALALLLAPSAASDRTVRSPSAPAGIQAGLVVASACAGALTIALQVLCIRLFALTLQNSTYTFGLIVAVFIVSLALGSRFAARVPGAAARRRAALAAQLAALGTLGVAPLFARITHFGVLRAPHFGGYVALAAGLVLPLLIVPVAAAGAILPLLWTAAPGEPGKTVGVLSAANGAGAAGGALLASFVLLPRVGLFASLAIVAALYAWLGWWLWGRSPRRLPVTLALLLACLLALTPALPLSATETLRRRWQTSYGLLDLIHDDAHGSLAARLDLHYELGRSADAWRHRSMGALPLALHGDPRSVLFLGLATGMTASAARAVESLSRIDIIELIPEMRELAHDFARYNAALLDDPRVTLRLGDARHELALSKQRYDVVVSDLFVPWHSHAGYLYTLEHFESVRTHLARRGLFVQWLPVKDLGPRELELIVQTFRRAFPDMEAWFDARDSAKPVLALAGGSVARTDLPPVAAVRLGRPRGLVTRELNRDERPLLEFWAPRSERNRQLLVGPRLTRWLEAHFSR